MMSAYQLLLLIFPLIGWTHIRCVLCNVCQCVGHHVMPFPTNFCCLMSAQPSLEVFLIPRFLSSLLHIFFKRFIWECRCQSNKAFIHMLPKHPYWTQIFVCLELNTINQMFYCIDTLICVTCITWDENENACTSSEPCNEEPICRTHLPS